MDTDSKGNYTDKKHTQYFKTQKTNLELGHLPLYYAVVFVFPVFKHNVLSC